MAVGSTEVSEMAASAGLFPKLLPLVKDETVEGVFADGLAVLTAFAARFSHTHPTLMA